MHDGGSKKTLRARRRRAAAATPDPEKVRRDLADYVDTLAGLMATSGLSETDVEDALKWPRGHLRRVFRRRQTLTFDDVLAVLEVIDVDPRRFFELLASPETEH